jgi:hypothetical protein
MNKEEYEEYLKTEHWQKERRGALKRAEYRCQVCNTDDTQLEVHHRTYERLGCEKPSDLFVLCESCHELFSQNGKLAEPDEEDDEWEVDDEYDEEWEADETERALSIPNPEGRLQTLASHAIHHPRLALGGGSMLLSLGVDVFVHFDPFIAVLGLGAAVVIGFKGDDLLFGTLKLLVPGSNQGQVREDADRWASQMLDDYPAYEDQSALAKIRRLFRLEEGNVVEESLPPLKKRDIKKLNGPHGHVNEEVLTFERIATGATQFFANFSESTHL